MGEETKRDRSTMSDFEKTFVAYKRITTVRHAEKMRCAELIEMAMYTAESEETQQALLDLAIKVLIP